ncbi:MAG: prenyltransferase/squalene oxidase repeat-containing protein [Sedimentisphaerales bacterium]|mgnify:CR=1 FL=1|jgi:squalene-hopene/tetraprenyl-beta-curcumene cyclase|nr:prenyltransferase/squalene oxidase repeat-containing protein [Sedimentisphaerales bacterium]HNY76915.1 prenyltransferase/squalene oxidase repeat-containing protein [Sedimentisphaerales bacterium]HOC62769.1 prenyltransferase/squalene oxidase repeat-containing protein [Sedimentisphaerales bacterium]HOH62689.1 prenyltransferase/squalene oxidase repeat-containing protein [Sedimentisphaerales bacterium]HPY51291.1 prenyltransferase/squalene oxidase repeat-containing protein [Sedimentisphaerales ba
MRRIDEERLNRTIVTLRERLLAARNDQGHWVGHLSSSALSTATAAFALAQVDGARHRTWIERGLHWLCENQNTDGGWGDTIESPSNLSTTLLCYSAMSVSEGGSLKRRSGIAGSWKPCPSPSDLRLPLAVEKAEAWLRREVGSLEPEALAAAVIARYGKDRTFSVPILTMCALAGRLGAGSQAWRCVKPLPFELAVLPHRLYKWLRLPVVSYALPALIAIGQARYEHRRPRCPVARLVRHLARRRSLDVLTTLQPTNGGFLEAAPLTSFVVMSLASSGQAEHPAVAKGVEFLVASIRDDGSWPIDTDLAIWGTTLSIAALTAGGNDGLADSEKQRLVDWLLACQHKTVHPYTQAAPGGWAWSNLPGAVPDADDTSGALLALHKLGVRNEAVSRAVRAGIGWLLDLQNRDGGIPTFCRGWTNLPFDRSAPDLTAHALGAMGVWVEEADPEQHTVRAMGRAMDFMKAAQRADGSWAPLWFGSQSAPNQENPVYGTSRVLTHLSRVPPAYHRRMDAACERGARWLLSAQNADGGWGGAPGVVSSIEETSLAVDALAGLVGANDDSRVCPYGHTTNFGEAIARGAQWLIEHTDQGGATPACPIGLYFAQLWYFEELYPIVFALSALGKAQAVRRFG